MPEVFEKRLTVEREHIDQQGHVSNVKYVEWMQAVAVAHSDALNWPEDRYNACNLAWVVRSHRIEYFQPVFEGDEITVRTWVESMDKVASLRMYEFRRGSEHKPVVKAETNWVMINTGTRNPCRIPQDLRDDFLVDK